MSNLKERFSRVLVSVILISLGGAFFTSCQKANPTPYSTPEAGVTNTINPTYTVNPPPPPPPDTTPSFKAAINGGSVLTFTPSKSIVGLKTTLKGVTASYTITITFPSSTGPGTNYNMGFGGPGITATLINGSSTYVVNNTYGVGFLTIDSISSKGKYYGKFNFVGDDTVTVNSITVNQGSFYHL